MDTVAEAKRKCPSLVLVHTETFSHLDLNSSDPEPKASQGPKPLIDHEDHDHDDEDIEEGDRDLDREEDLELEVEVEVEVGPEEGGFFLDDSFPSKARSAPSSSSSSSTSEAKKVDETKKVKGTEKVTLRRYREASGRVFDILRSVGFDLSSSSCSSSSVASIFKGEEGRERRRVLVEKASVDEAYLDLTEMCQRRVSAPFPSSTSFPSSSSSPQAAKSLEGSEGAFEQVAVTEEEWKALVLSPNPSLLSPHDLLLFHASHVLLPSLSLSFPLFLSPSFPSLLPFLLSSPPSFIQDGDRRTDREDR